MNEVKRIIVTDASFYMVRHDHLDSNGEIIGSSGDLYIDPDHENVGRLDPTI